jgi:hypothetical protein
MIDKPDRKTPRFPPSLESPARTAISSHIHSFIAASTADDVCGYASLARGGDILFHEVCRTHGLRTVIVLPFAPELFLEKSVEGVPSGNWVPRFKELWEDTPSGDRLVMGLPTTDAAYGLCNTRILELARTADRLHLIALWDGAGGDGRGGTADMVKQAKALDDNPKIIHPEIL